jgi:hypothetical protein
LTNFKHGVSVELIPLAPGHAYNRTDARLAHLNTFFDNLKRHSRVFGAKGMAEALRKMTKATTSKRKYLKRSHVFFRVVKGMEQAARDEKKSKIKEMMVLPSGARLGVKGLLYFKFIRPGWALVREHGDPQMANNPTRVYTWRKDLLKMHCQLCSDRQKEPVLLAQNGCSKSRCAFAPPAPVHVPVELPLENENAAPSESGRVEASGGGGGGGTKRSQVNAGNIAPKLPPK